MDDQKKDRKEKRVKKRISREYVKTKRLDWDVWFINSIINDEGFIISEPATISLDGRQHKTMYGPNSPLFGTSYGDDQAFMERHRCSCGAFKGLQFEGEECPLCHTKIEARDVNIKMTGWILLGSGNVIINPYWYKIFLRLIGSKIFPQIVGTDERVDKNGIRHKLIPGVDYEQKTPYDYIGIEGFYTNFDEIINYFQKKKKKHAEELEKCKAEKSKIFTSHIPVYSTALRPSSSTADTFYFNGIDKQINPLFNLCQSIQDCEEIEKPYLQARIQDRVNTMWDFNFDLINKKEGFIRNKLIAGALNYTARCVITPRPSLRVDEVVVSYQQFRVQMKYRIIYYLMNIDGCSLSTAYYRWKDAYKFDEHVYNIMLLIIEREHPRILLNRNPTINYYSMLLMRIASVNRDPYRTTLEVPLSINLVMST